MDLFRKQWEAAEDKLEKCVCGYPAYMDVELSQDPDLVITAHIAKVLVACKRCNRHIIRYVELDSYGVSFENSLSEVIDEWNHPYDGFFDILKQRIPDWATDKDIQFMEELAQHEPQLRECGDTKSFWEQYWNQGGEEER